MSTKPESFRIIVDRNPAGKGWVWVFEWQLSTGWMLEKTGRKRSRRAALREARYHRDRHVMGLGRGWSDGAAQYRVEELQTVVIPLTGHDKKPSPLEPEYLLNS